MDLNFSQKRSTFEVVLFHAEVCTRGFGNEKDEARCLLSEGTDMFISLYPSECGIMSVET